MEQIIRRYKHVISKTICHDLRTPLNGILTPLEQLEPSDFSSLDTQLPIKLMKMSAQFLEYKVEDMIYYSLIELNEFTSPSSQYRFKKMLLNVKHLCDYQAELNNLELKIEIDKELPEIGYGDRKRITQILLHLVQNAIKFTKLGCIYIYVKLNKDSKEEFEFGVKDPGMGMNIKAKSYLKKFLEDGIPSETDENENKILNITEMGFGLWITQKICKQLDSKLEFTSSEHLGSNFYFRMKNREKAASSISIFKNISQESYKELNPLQKRHNTIPTLKQIDLIKTEDTSEIKNQNFRERFEIENPFKSEEKNGPLEKEKKRNFYRMNLDKREIEESNNPMLKVTPMNLLNSKVVNMHKLEEITEFEIEQSPFKAMKLHTTKIPIRARHSISTDVSPIISPIQGQFPPQTTRARGLEIIAKFSSLCYSALVVDDMPVNRLVLKGLLQKRKFKVDEASNGKQAVQLCKNKILNSVLNKPYDIIFMDIEMPIMNGLQATQKLTTIFKKYSFGRVPIIAVTAHETQLIKAQAFESGVAEFALKPMKNQLLQYYLKKYLPDAA